MGTRRRMCAALGALAVVGTSLSAAGCSSSSSAARPTMVIAGQLPGSALPNLSAGERGKLATATTVPLAQENPTTLLFQAIGSFQACLQGLGITFVGAPNPSDPSSPANNPTYVKGLGTCAARSDILQALKAEQSAQDNLTPAQVKTENQEYLKWRKCMIGLGWSIPTPEPNSKGLLFSFGTSGGAADDMRPPSGQTLFSSNDMQSCASKILSSSNGSPPGG